MSKNGGGEVHGKLRDLQLEAQWRKALSRQQRSGVTAREFCRREGVKESAFHFWKRELTRRDAESPARHVGNRSSIGRRERAARLPSLVPVMIGPANLQHTAAIEVVLSQGVSVRVAAGCDEAMLRMVIAALERES